MKIHSKTVDISIKTLYFTVKICGFPQKLTINYDCSTEKLFKPTYLGLRQRACKGRDKRAQMRQILFAFYAVPQLPLNINDSFKKIIITGDGIKRKTNEKGILTMGLLDFLLDENCI